MPDDDGDDDVAGRVRSSVLPVAGGNWRLSLSHIQVGATTRTSDDDDADAATTTTTIVFAHATGMHKELFLPTMRHLLRRLDSNTTGRIHMIAVDARNHGASATLNAHNLTDPSYTFRWRDAAEDLLAVIHHHHGNKGGRLIGVGHSFGGSLLLMAALATPFDALVLVEPILQAAYDGNGTPVFSRVADVDAMIARVPIARAAAARRARFAGREECARVFGGKRFFAGWTRECLGLHVAHGVVDDGGGVRLACSPRQEAVTFAMAVETSETYARLVRDGLRGVRVVVVAGAGSDHLVPTFPLADGRMVVRDRHLAESVLENAELVVVEGCGHMVVCEKPEAVAHEISRVLKMKTRPKDAAKL